MRLLKALAAVSGLTALSRVAGFVRDILMAAILGAGPVADAFFVALKLPNLFRRITAEGAFTVAFVPTYADKDEKLGKEAAAEYAGRVASVMMSVLIPLSLIVMWCMPFVISLIAPGFAAGEMRFDLAVEFTRVTFPYLALISFGALLGGMMNAHDKFAPFAAAPILFNLCLISGLLLSGLFETAGHALVWAVAFSGVLQTVFLYYCLKRYRIDLNFKKPKFDKDIKKLFKLMAPGIVGAGVVQINIFVDVILASFLQAGAISALYYADRLNQLPLGIIGIAIGTALLPMMSRAVSSGDKFKTQGLFDQSLFFGLLLAMPAATALAVMPHVLIEGLFERGAFTSEATHITSGVLRAYALGLPAFILAKVFSTLYFSHQDTVTPVKISIVGTLLNIGLSLILIREIGVMGIALATSLTTWMQIALYLGAMKRSEYHVYAPRFKTQVIQITLCALVMGLSIMLADVLLPFEAVVKMVILVLLGLIVYFFSVVWVKLIRMDDFNRIMGKNKNE